MRVPDRERSGTLILPFIGLHSFQDSDDRGLDAGLRVGSFFGRYISNDWSMNGLAEIDILNPNSQASGVGIDLSAEMLGLTFNPLFHVGNAKAEFVIGPKIGGWIEWAHISVNNPAAGVSTSGDGTAEGWTMGANMGVFIPVSPSVLAGGLMSLETRDILHACSTVGGMSMCRSNGNSATILGFGFGLLL
jgi:hypothetical protein